MLFGVRLAIRFGFTGSLEAGIGGLYSAFFSLTCFSSERFFPEKIGSKESSPELGPAIFFLRLAVLSE